MFDLLVELVGWLFVELVKGMCGAVSDLAKGTSRAVNLWRKAPEDTHTAVEYVDALLFAEESSNVSEASRPRSTYHR